MKKLVFILSVSLFLIFIFSSFPVFASENIIFEDYFDDGTDSWDIVSGDWKIEEFDNNKMFGSRISRRNTVSETFLKTLDIEDYVFELKMLALSGADKNLIFRIENASNHYGIHMDSDRDIVCVEKWINDIGWDDCKKWSFSNNVVYNLKIVAIKNRILFYVDEKLVFDFTDEEKPIYTGTVGLKVSTGATYPSEVYFDDIRITKINTPVVLVPGHGASFNFKEMFLNQSDPDGWHMTPGVNVYDNIIASLEANGYEKNKDLFVFNYNWLNSISDTAGKLYNFIEGITSFSSVSTVKVVGHSMGGLVARACFREKDNECFIDQLITVGSPHRGVLDAYGAWEGGEIWRDGLTKLAFELFLNTQKQPLETDKEALRRLSPALAEMLPDFAYLKDEQGNETNFNDNDYPLNPLLEKIGPIASPNDKVDFVFGKNKETLRWLVVDKNLAWFDQILGNWQFGRPTEKEFLNDGDGTVLSLSAYPDEGLSGRFFDLNHRELIADPVAVAEIMVLLGLEPKPDLEFLANEENFLVFYLHSPAHLEVTGLSQKDLFLGNDSGSKLIIIASPDQDQDYLVSVVGDETGPYRLTVGKIYDSGTSSSWKDYAGLISPGQTDTFKIGLSKPIEVDTSGTLHPIEEAFQDLITSGDQGLVTRASRWQSLTANDYRQSLIYGYRLRNWLSVLTRRSLLGKAELISSLTRVGAVIAHLEELALGNSEPVSDDEFSAVFNFWQQELSDFYPLSFEISDFSKLASLDYLASGRYLSLISQNQDNYQNLIYSFSGEGLLRNSRVLLQED